MRLSIQDSTGTFHSVTVPEQSIDDALNRVRVVGAVTAEGTWINPDQIVTIDQEEDA